MTLRLTLFHWNDGTKEWKQILPDAESVQIAYAPGPFQKMKAHRFRRRVWHLHRDGKHISWPCFYQEGHPLYTKTKKTK